MKEYWLDKENEYYRKCVDGSYELVDGIPVIIPGYGEMDVFVCKRPYGWAGMLGVTGHIISVNDGREAGTLATHRDYYATKEEAIEHLIREFSLANGDRKLIAKEQMRMIDFFGLSPRYRWEDMEEIEDGRMR